MKILYFFILLQSMIICSSEINNTNSVTLKHNLEWEIYKNNLNNKIDLILEKQNSKIENTLDKVDLVKDRIDNISNAIDRFGVIVAFFGILVTLLVIYFSFKTKSEAITETKNWINQEGEEFINKELKPVRESFNKNLEKMQEELIALKNQSNIEIKQLKEKLNKEGNTLLENLSSKISENNITTNELSIEDKRFFESQIKSIKYKPLKDRTFQDYKKLILFDIASKNYKKAMNRIDTLINENLKKERLYELYLLKANIYEKQYHYNESLKLINMSIEICPKKSKAFVEKARIFNIELQNYKEAQKLAKKAIKLNKYNYEAFIALAYSIRNEAYYEKKFEYYQKAIDINKKAIDINPDLELAYNNIGSIYRMQNDYNNAEIWYRKAIEANPNEWVYNNIFQLNLISNKPFDPLLEKEYLAQYKDIKSNNFAIYQMLKILQKIKEGKIHDIKANVENWSKKYKIIHFSFVTLQKWADNENDKLIKENLKEAIKLFKSYRINRVLTQQ